MSGPGRDGQQGVAVRRCGGRGFDGRGTLANRAVQEKHPEGEQQGVDQQVTPGTDAFEFTPAVDIEKNDRRITKRYGNSFNKTGLDMALREMECETVLIVGLSASGCAIATCFGARDYDFHSYLVKGGVASHDEEHVRFAEEICETLGVDEFDQRLQASPEQDGKGEQEFSSVL